MAPINCRFVSVPQKKKMKQHRGSHPKIVKLLIWSERVEVFVMEVVEDVSESANVRIGCPGRRVQEEEAQERGGSNGSQ